MDLVSVIIPVYNVEKYLQRCLDSVIKQTYENIEIILIDDGSTDSCPKICDAYSKKDHRIRVIHQKNTGLSGARNIGIDSSKGEYLCFIDSDDWIHSNFIEQLYSDLTKYDVDIAVCKYINTSDDIIVDVKVTESNLKVINKIEALGMMKNSQNVFMTVAWNKLYKKTLFDQIRYPLGRLHEDEFTTYKVIYNSNSISINEASLYYYFQRESSIMSTPSLKSWIDGKDALIERMIFFRDHGMKEYSAVLFYDIEYNILFRSRTDSNNIEMYLQKYINLIKISKGIIPFRYRLLKYLRTKAQLHSIN